MFGPHIASVDGGLAYRPAWLILANTAVAGWGSLLPYLVLRRLDIGIDPSTLACLCIALAILVTHRVDRYGLRRTDQLLSRIEALDIQRTREVIAAGPWRMAVGRSLAYFLAVGVPLMAWSQLSLDAIRPHEGILFVLLIAMMSSQGWFEARSAVPDPPSRSERWFAAFASIILAGGGAAFLASFILPLIAHVSLKPPEGILFAGLIFLVNLAIITYGGRSNSQRVLKVLGRQSGTLRAEMWVLGARPRQVILFGTVAGMLPVLACVLAVLAVNILTGQAAVPSDLGSTGLSATTLGLPYLVFAVMLGFGAFAGLVDALLQFRPWQQRDEGAGAAG